MELAQPSHRHRLMRGPIVFGLLALLIAACGADEGEGADDIGVIGEWEMVEGTIDGDPFPLVDGWRITMNVGADGRIGGTAACNGYGGTYVADGEDLIISDVSMTMMACEPPVQDAESAFVAAIGQPLTYQRAGDRLTLTGGQAEMVFTAVEPVPTAELIGTEWTLDTLIQGESASSVLGDPATLLLTEDGRVVGSTGCRELAGEYIINADTVRFTSFQAFGECTDELRSQDNLVVTVLGDGFTVAVEANRLTIEASGGEGLSYTVAP